MIKSRLKTSSLVTQLLSKNVVLFDSLVSGCTDKLFCMTIVKCDARYCFAARVADWTLVKTRLTCFVKLVITLGFLFHYDVAVFPKAPVILAPKLNICCIHHLLLYLCIVQCQKDTRMSGPWCKTGTSVC